jgi:hypothetical protein
MRSTTFVFIIWYTSIQEFGVFGAQTGAQEINCVSRTLRRDVVPRCHARARARAPRPQRSRPCATRGVFRPRPAAAPGRAGPEAARAPRRAGVLLTVDYRIKVHMDLHADKSTVVVMGPFFPRVVNPRYRIRGTMCNARV